MVKTNIPGIPWKNKVLPIPAVHSPIPNAGKTPGARDLPPKKDASERRGKIDAGEGLASRVEEAVS